MRKTLAILSIVAALALPALAAWFYPTRYGGNPVITYGGPGTWKNFQVLDPNVLVDPFDSTKLLMFHGGETASALGNYAVGRATTTVSNPMSWTEDDAHNPVLPGTGGSNWDCCSIRINNILVNGTTLTMYYTGDVDATGNATQMGMATSTDDGITWTLNPANPILTPTGNGRNDGYSVSQGVVLKLSPTSYIMYYSYRNAAVLPGIRYATSPDGVTWTKAGAGDLFSKGTGCASDSMFIEYHQILTYGGYYIIVYEARNSCSLAWTHNAAYSTNPTSGWVKSVNNPLFIPSGVASAFDQYQVATPFWFQPPGGGAWLMMFQGGDNANYGLAHWKLGMATLAGTPADLIGAGGGAASFGNTISLGRTQR